MRTTGAGAPIAPLTVRLLRRAREPNETPSTTRVARTQARARAADYVRTLCLPRGRGDLVRQVIIWFGFAFAYQLVRGLANRGPELALGNARAVVRLERGLHMLLELRLQRALNGVEPLIAAANLTYWLSQFAVVGGALLWIYLRRYPWYLRVRDTIIVTNTIALVGYVLVPTAPPRLLTGMGFRDTLTTSALLNHGSGIVRLAENPYAAMPSLHTADAVIIGVALALLVRRPWLRVLWVLWPPFVAFSLVVTGNHYLSDIVAGILLVSVAAPATAALERLRRQPPSGLNEA
jgi:membrane-associated phospholipid phosphatase